MSCERTVVIINSEMPMNAPAVGEALGVVAHYARDFWVLFGPGGQLHPAYFLEHKGHLVIEGLLCVVILYMVLQHSFKPRPHSEDALTDKVRIETRCDDEVAGTRSGSPGT